MNTDEIIFELIHGGMGKYTNFVLVIPIKRLPASRANDRVILDCVIDFGISTPVTLSPCSDANHGEHDYLIPFYKTSD